MDESTSSSTLVDRDSTIRQPRPHTSLSTSEPSLRFPRPLGNRRLANWVSSSQPDIMSADTNTNHDHPSSELPEESGLLSESAYEVINNTDTESQDGFHTESVCSSDYLHGDDVHSLVSTEDTGDDNDDRVHDSDASEGVVLPSPVRDADDPDPAGRGDDRADDIYSAYEEEHLTAELQADLPRRGQGPEDTAGSAATPAAKSPEDEKNRTSALQYAEESLETPSASIHADMDEQDVKFPRLAEWRRELVTRNVPPFVLSFWFFYMLWIACVFFYGNAELRRPGPAVPAEPAAPVVKTTVSISTSTVIINHTSTKTLLISETRTAAPSLTTTTTTTKTETLLLPSAAPQRASEKATEGEGFCSVEMYSPKEILVRMPHTTKLYWLAKDSISIEVARGQEAIRAKFSSVDEGILVEISKTEAHGVLNVSVTTARRPKVNVTFVVDFGKGIVDSTMDLGRLLAQDVANILAAAAAESTRSAEEIKVKASEARKSLEEALGAASGEIMKAWQEGARVLPSIERPFVSWLAAGWDSRARVLEDEMEMSLLQAQVSAKALWLRMKGDREAHDDFVHKARAFVAQRATEATWRRIQRGEAAARGGGRGNTCEAEGWKRGFSRWGRVRGCGRG